MKHHFLSVVVLAASCGACSVGSGYSIYPQQDVIQAIEESTAVLVGHDSDGEVDRVCSAVWVSQIELLTAAHCMELAISSTDEEQEDTGDLIGKKIDYINHQDLGNQLLTNATASGDAIIVAVDFKNDLALLSGHRQGHGVASIEEGPIYQGEDIWTMGHTFGLPYSLSSGCIGDANRRIKRNGTPVHVLQVVSGANFGNSGGGVWSKEGKLLGIASFRRLDSSLVFFVHRDEIVDFLHKEAGL